MSDPGQADGTQEIPTFVECVLGYRVWRADAERRLWPIYSARRPWLPGINTARCNCGSWTSLRFEWCMHEGRRVLAPAPEHPAPDASCRCGLYSWRQTGRHWNGEPFLEARVVMGAVASWGRLQVHADGFRAEHACIVTLAHPEGAHASAMTHLREVAASYRVQLVPLSELEEAASEHGTPLPAALRPAAERDLPAADPSPALPHEVEPSPNASIEEVGTPPPKVGFDGQPLSDEMMHGGYGL